MTLNNAELFRVDPLDKIKSTRAYRVEERKRHRAATRKLNQLLIVHAQEAHDQGKSLKEIAEAAGMTRFALAEIAKTQGTSISRRKPVE